MRVRRREREKEREGGLGERERYYIVLWYLKGLQPDKIPVSAFGDKVSDHLSEAVF